MSGLSMASAIIASLLAGFSAGDGVYNCYSDLCT
jgi:hypothetical protein